PGKRSVVDDTDLRATRDLLQRGGERNTVRFDPNPNRQRGGRESRRKQQRISDAQRAARVLCLCASAQRQRSDADRRSEKSNDAGGAERIAEARHCCARGEIVITRPLRRTSRSSARDSASSTPDRDSFRKFAFSCSRPSAGLESRIVTSYQRSMS